MWWSALSPTKKKEHSSVAEGIPWCWVNPEKLVVFVVQLLSHVWLFVTPWTAACQASLFFTISWSLFKFVSILSVMPSNHLILCGPLLRLPSILPSIKVFSNKSALCIGWPKYWSFIEASPNLMQSWITSKRMGCLRWALMKYGLMRWREDGGLPRWR